MFTALLVLVCAVFVAYILPQFRLFKFRIEDKILPEQRKPVSSIIHLFSGPNDGAVQEIEGAKEDLPHFLITPYMPKDEEGNPQPDEENLIPGPGGMVYVKPSLAFYQQVTDEDYIYVRDINDTEFRKIQMTGQLPKFTVDDHS